MCVFMLELAINNEKKSRAYDQDVISQGFKKTKSLGITSQISIRTTADIKVQEINELSFMFQNCQEDSLKSWGVKMISKCEDKHSSVSQYDPIFLVNMLGKVNLKLQRRLRTLKAMSHRCRGVLK
jgi:hypothetical protein